MTWKDGGDMLRRACIAMATKWTAQVDIFFASDDFSTGQVGKGKKRRLREKHAALSRRFHGKGSSQF